MLHARANMDDSDAARVACAFSSHVIIAGQGPSGTLRREATDAGTYATCTCYVAHDAAGLVGVQDGDAVGALDLAQGLADRLLQVGLGLALGLPLLAWWLGGAPTAMNVPTLTGFNFKGGVSISPEFTALLLGLGGWRALFWCIVPLAITVALIAGPHLSRATVAPGERSEEHWGWLLWLVLGIFGLQYAIHEIPSASNAARSPAFVMGAASAAALTLFAWRQWKKDRPLIDYRSLLQWRYLLGLTLYFFGYFMAGTSGFLLPIFFREGLGLPLTTTALVLSFGLFGSVAAAMLHAAVARRRPRPLAFMMTGLALYAIVCLAFSQARLLSDWHLLLVPVLLSGIAVAFFFGPVAFGTFTELPPKVFSHGYQVKNIVRQLGISSSIALSTMALQFFYARRLAALPEGFHPEWAQALHGLSDASAGLVAPLTLACSDLFFVLALCALPVALLVMWQRTFR